MQRTGGCLCGAVKYNVTGDMRPVVSCHCQQCRKTSGHFVAATSAAHDAVEIDGDVSWYASSPTAKRGFCGTCGSNLFWHGSGSHLSIFAGTLDDASGLQTIGHIFMADKGTYYDITDGLPQAAQDDVNLTTQVI